MLGDELLARRRSASQPSRSDMYRTLMLSRVGVAALSALSLLALFLYLRQSLALKRSSGAAAAWCRPNATGSRSKWRGAPRS